MEKGGEEMEQGGNGKRRAADDDDDDEVGNQTAKRNKKESGLSAKFADSDVFDCFVCMEVLSPPVFQCQNGHLACSKCCKDMEYKCPSCRMPIGSIRCLAFEKLLESMKVSCDYEEYGCTQSLTCAEKLKHQETCAFAPFTCPVDDCGLSFPSSKLELHVSKEHRPFVVRRFHYNQRFVTSVDKSQKYKVFQGIANGRVFVLSHQAKAGSTTTMSMSLACLGSRTDQTDGFKYELLLKKDQRSYRLQSLTERVRKRSEAAAVVDVLNVPDDFYTSDEKVKMDIRINE